MNKTAILNNLNPMQVALYSLLAGGGAFGASKLLMDVMNASKPQAQDTRKQMPVYIPSGEPTANTSMSSSPEASGGVSIPQLKTAAAEWKDIGNLLTGNPMLMEPARQEALQRPGVHDVLGAKSLTPPDPAAHAPGDWNWLEKSVLGVPMLGLGFMGGKALYDKYQSDKLKGELDQVKQQYMRALDQAKMQKMSATNTPCLDGFCEQLAEIFKQANENDPSGFIYGSIMKPLMGLGKDIALPIGAASALGSLWYLMKQNQQKRDAEAKRNFPEDVVLANQMTR